MDKIVNDTPKGTSFRRNTPYDVYIAKIRQSVFGRPFVKRLALRYRTVVCLSVYLVTSVYCGQTVEWIKMSLGMEVGLGPGDIVLDGDPAPPRKGAQQLPHFSAHFSLTRSPISATAELLLHSLLQSFHILYDGPPLSTLSPK